MPGKRGSTVHVEYVTVFLYTPPVTLHDSYVGYNVDYIIIKLMPLNCCVERTEKS